MRHYTQVTFRSYLCTLLMFLYNAKLHISFKNLCKILLCVNFTKFQNVVQLTGGKDEDDEEDERKGEEED